MSRQARSRWAAGAGAAFLALTMSSVALAAPAATTHYVDANGNRIDDSCETNVVPDPVAAAASFAAADLDHDGTISESEALQAGWIGSENCVGGGDTGPVTPPAPAPTPPTPAPGATNPPKDDGSNHACAPRRSHGSGHRHHHHHGHGNGGHHGNSRNGRS